jgi:hypothetical protein
MFAMVFKRFSGIFFQVFQKYVSSVLSVFRHMLHVLHLDVSKVDRMFRMGCVCEARGGASGPVRNMAAWESFRTSES